MLISLASAPHKSSEPAWNSEPLHYALRLLGFVVELAEGVEELLHLLLQGRVSPVCVTPGALGVAHLDLGHLVPAPVLLQVRPQAGDLPLEHLVPLLQAGGRREAQSGQRNALHTHTIHTLTVTHSQTGSHTLALSHSDTHSLTHTVTHTHSYTSTLTQTQIHSYTLIHKKH